MTEISSSKVVSTNVQSGAVELVGHIGRKMSMLKTAVSTAQTLIHAFFASNCANDFDAPLIALSALYLASKIEECPCRLRDAISVAHRHLHPDKPLLDVNDEYWDIRDSVVFLYIYAMTVCTTMPNGEAWVRKVTQLAYMILNDSYRCPTISKSEPHIRAVAALYLALRLLGLSADIKGQNVHWWEIMDCPSNKLDDMVTLMMNTCDTGKAI
eukprot:CFRG2624T1